MSEKKLVSPQLLERILNGPKEEDLLFALTALSEQYHRDFADRINNIALDDQSQVEVAAKVLGMLQRTAANIKGIKGIESAYNKVRPKLKEDLNKIILANDPRRPQAESLRRIYAQCIAYATGIKLYLEKSEALKKKKAEPKADSTSPKEKPVNTQVKRPSEDDFEQFFNEELATVPTAKEPMPKFVEQEEAKPTQNVSEPSSKPKKKRNWFSWVPFIGKKKGPAPKTLKEMGTEQPKEEETANTPEAADRALKRAKLI